MYHSPGIYFVYSKWQLLPGFGTDVKIRRISRYMPVLIDRSTRILLDGYYWQVFCSHVFHGFECLCLSLALKALDIRQYFCLRFCLCEFDIAGCWSRSWRWNTEGLMTILITAERSWMLRFLPR